jgi:hypothetical protein
MACTFEPVGVVVVGVVVGVVEFDPLLPPQAPANSNAPQPTTPNNRLAMVILLLLLLFVSLFALTLPTVRSPVAVFFIG